MGGTKGIEDANHLVEAGVHVPSIETRPCDCFFVVDSCFTPEISRPFPSDTMQVWNNPVSGEDGSVHQRLAAKVLEQMQMRTAVGASCFSRTCRIYAPRYRQVSVLALVGYNESLGSGGDHENDLKGAIDLAYNDVRQAFLQFVDDPANSTRPFILAGHSQGSMHLVRLLQEEVENHPLRLRRFVHAYLTGWCVPMEVFSHSLKNVRPSTCASDICSVSSWRTGAEDHTDLLGKLIVAGFFSGVGWQRISQRFLANNPITWSAESARSDPAAHRGAMWPLPSNLDPRDHAGVLSSGVSLRFGHLSAASQDVINVSIPALVRVQCGQVQARLDERGMLRVPRLCDSLFSLAERDWLLYHDLDIALFHINVSENAALRLDAWRLRSKL